MFKLKTYIYAVLCLTIILCLSGCSANKIADSTLTQIKDKSITVSAKSENNSIYKSNKSTAKMTKICSMDMLTLYFDKENYSVAVYDKTSSYLWRSLPESYNKSKTSVVSVNVIIDGNEYTLSSQSDSVAFSSSLYDIGDTFVSVNYGFKRTLEDSTKISINVPVTFSLKDGVFSAEVDCANLVSDETDKNVILKSISVLPFFGSSAQGNKGDYIVLPDGSGTLLDISEKAKSFKTLKTSVYDGATIGAFGIKRKNSAFVCLIEQGEEISAISADKALESKGYNAVGASFEITPTLKQDKDIYISNESYKGKIKLSYRFLSYESANYVSMASAVRELLIRNGKLTESNLSSASAYDFNLKLHFKKDGKQVTTLSECYDLLSTLKAKGFDSINLILSGLFKEDSYSLNKSSEEEMLQKIRQYASVQGVKLIGEAFVYKTQKDFALDIKGEQLQASSQKKLEDNASAVLFKAREANFDGIVVNDAGEYIYSDFTKGSLSLKNDLAEKVSVILRSFSAVQKLMVTKGNLYAVKYASDITEMSFESTFAKRKYCSSIPFVQSVMHGTLQYSHSAINLNEDMTYAVLKSAEYAAVPYFEWYFKDLTQQDEKDNYYYNNSLFAAQSMYEKMKATFYDLSDARITAHEKVKKDVYRTELDNSTEIYVNYSDKTVTVNGVVVDAKSFVRVN